MTLPGVQSRRAEPLVGQWVVTISGYVGALFVAELLVAEAGFFIGGMSHLLLLLVLLVHYMASDEAAYRPMLAALTLPSLMRLVSLTVTVVELPVVLWYVMIGVPTFLALLLVLRVVPVRLAPLVSGRSNAPLQVILALGGIAHGLLLYLLIRPAALIPLTDPGRAIAAAVVILVFVAILEEVIFRGVILGAALDVTGSRAAAIAISGAVYACMFVSASSPLVPLLMLIVGLLFATIVVLTSSLWGVIGAHALMSVGILIVWPAMVV